MQTRTAVQFSRVSSTDQRDGFSLEAQVGLGTQYAKENKLHVVKSWQVDESASKELDRKNFFAMVEYIKLQGVKDVIFDRIDRACRGMRSAVVIEELVDMGVRFHFTRDRLIIDKDSPSQEKLRFYLGVILGKYYVDNLKAEIKKGREAKLKAGLWVGKAPVGYLNKRDTGTGKAIVMTDAHAAPVIREVFQRYSTGNYGFDRLAEYMSKEIPGDRVYTKRTVEELISNPFYYGDLKINGAIVNKGIHEPLITKQLWNACQKVRGIRASNKKSNPEKQLIAKALMGLMTCGCCNHAITGETKKVKGRVYIYYRCANHGCDQRRRYYREDRIMAMIAEVFSPFRKFTPEATKAFLDTMSSKLEDLHYYTDREHGRVAAKLLDVKKKLDDADRLFARGILSRAEYDRVLEIRSAAFAETENELHAYTTADARTFLQGRKIIETFHKAYDFMTLGKDNLKKAELAKLVLSKLSLSSGNLEFSYQNPFDVLLDLTKVPVWWRRREPSPEIVLQLAKPRFDKIFELLAA